MSTFEKNSAQLEREVEEQRQRIENRVGEIKERLSPGQLVDEVLSYTKTGGQQFATNLGSTISANPLPAALLGVSLIWLISGQNQSQASSVSTQHRREPEHPYATVSGGLRRVSHAADDTGDWYSEFHDPNGRRFKAKSNALGHRVGEFIDESGRAFGGFIDETGHRVSDFTDEVGNRFDEASGWASHRFHDLKHGIAGAVNEVVHQAQNIGGGAQHQIGRTTGLIASGYQNQPLVAGALAFAVGAAIGAALPHTKQEDRLVGDLADKVRDKANDMASEAYDASKDTAHELYDRGREAAGEFVDKVVGEEERQQSPDYH